MTGQELYAERDEIKKSLNHSMEKMYTNGVNWGEKTKAYRTILAQTILMLKAEGMQISIIDKVAKGTEEVAQAELDMMTAEVLYRSSMENIMIQKKLLDSVEDEIKREWGRSA